MSDVLYGMVNDAVFDNTVSELNKYATGKADAVRLELKILFIFIVDVALCSPSLASSFKRNSQRLLAAFLAHFKEESEKSGKADFFIDLLEQRSNLYYSYIKSDSANQSIHFGTQIAEKIAEYCGAENQPIFLMRILAFWKTNFETVDKFFKELKLI